MTPTSLDFICLEDLYTAKELLQSHPEFIEAEHLSKTDIKYAASIRTLDTLIDNFPTIKAIIKQAIRQAVLEGNIENYTNVINFDAIDDYKPDELIALSQVFNEGSYETAYEATQRCLIDMDRREKEKKENAQEGTQEDGKEV